MDGRRGDVIVQSHIPFLPQLTHLTDLLPEQRIRPQKLRNIWGTSGNLVLHLVGRPPDGIRARTTQDVLETAFGAADVLEVYLVSFVAQVCGRLGGI